MDFYVETLNYLRYHKILRCKEGMSNMKLVGRCWKKQATHVDRQEVGAVATSNGDGLEQTSARNTHLNTNKKQQKPSKNRKVGAKNKIYRSWRERIKRERKRDRRIPRGQCHRSCNGRNRAGRRGRGGPEKRQWMRRTFLLILSFSLSLSRFISLWIRLIDGTDRSVGF